MSPWDIHANSSLHDASFSEGDGGHWVDALGHILVRDPGLQLLIDDESLRLLDGAVQFLVRVINLHMPFLRVLVCADPSSAEI